MKTLLLTLGLALSIHASADVPTFATDIAPIIFNNCTSCHRTGEAAPFPLTTYKEVRKKGRLIAQVTEERVMPPWKVREHPGVDFFDSRALTEEEIATLATWAKAGMPEGDPAKTPALPTFSSGWQLGEPDLIISMPKAYNVPADGRDIYRNFVIPMNLDEDKWIKAIEFRPGTPAVHHALFHLDPSDESRRADAADPVPGFKKMSLGARRGATRDRNADSGNGGQGGIGSGGLGGWAVGGTARPLPDGLAYFLPKEADFVIATHFHPTGKVELERSTIGLHFTDKEPTHAFGGIQLPPAFGAFAGIDIPPGEANYQIRDSFVLPSDVKAFGVSAHAHYIGRSMLMTATTPDGSTLTLLDIPDWDFNWQEQYQYETFIPLPKGTKIDSLVTWDNSAQNPFNPSDPPVRVRWGKESEDEMGSITLLVCSDDKDAVRTITRAMRQHTGKALAGRVGDARRQRGNGGAGKSGPLRQAVMQRFDTDKDGKLSESEIQTIKETYKDRPGVLRRLRQLREE